MAGEKNSKYKSEYDKQAYKLCLLGATDKQLADFFDVTERTINTWKENHSTFFQSLKSGKLHADAVVADSLFNRAIGYSHPEEKIFNNQGEIVTYDTIKHYAPDTTAAIFWLKNRQPAIWRDKKEVDMSISDDFDSLLDDAADD